jgi:hypothetical protein
MNLIDLPATKARVTQWLVWSGLTCLILAAICILASFIIVHQGMADSFAATENAPAADNSARVTHSVALAAIPGFAVAPLGVVGISLLLLGLTRRRRQMKGAREKREI